jgi:hypothetical protein
MGLNGPVRKVQVEFNEYRWEASRWEPSGDPIHDVMDFDRNGRCLTPHIDPGSGWRQDGVALAPANARAFREYEIVRKATRQRMGWKSVWKFDKEGRLGRFEAYALYESGPSLSNWQQYSYDSQGRVEQLTYWANWGWGPKQTEPYPPVQIKYWFDSAGRIGGWAEVGNPVSRSILTYDQQGRLVKAVYEEELHVITKTWDGYDQQGNWTVETTTQAWREEDGDEPFRKEVRRRSITYRRASNKQSALARK